MRLIKTFILRLNIDNEQPDRICGALQALPASNTYSFRNSEQLLQLLKHLADASPEDSPMNLSGNENEADLSDPNPPIE